MRLYLDAAPVIYWVEQVAPFYPQVNARIKSVGVSLVASHLTLMECLVGPLARGNISRQQEYDSFFATQLAEMVGLDETIFRRAADIRAKHNVRTSDALHLAAALESGCDVFLTNDARLRSFPDIPVEVVS